LHQRAMENFVKNETLIAPILKALWLEWGKVEVKEFKDWKITLDILKDNVKKQVTLEADLKFGYFTQCVNHTLILSDISATTEDGASVHFNSGVWEPGVNKEWNKLVKTSTYSITVGIAVTTGGWGDSGIKTEWGTSSTELPSTTPSQTNKTWTSNGPAGDWSKTNSSYWGRG
jgi:hypothetical protein